MLANHNIEEERSLRVEYKSQDDDEREARRAAKSDMKEYQDIAKAMREQVFIVQSELEIQEEELKKLKEQY